MGYLQINLVGYEEAVQLVDVFGMRVAEAAALAVYLEAKYELPLTKAQVPVETGNLKASGRVQKFPDWLGTVQAGIVYGGSAGSGEGQSEDVDYATIVHEDMTAHHEVGKAKYVEDVVNEQFNSGEAQRRMSNTFRSYLQLKGFAVSGG